MPAVEKVSEPEQKRTGSITSIWSLANPKAQQSANES